MFRRYRLKDYNFRLVLWLVVLSTLGVLLVGSAMESLMMRQLAGVVVGFCLMIMISFIDFSWILNFHWFYYFANIAVLLAVRLLGDSSGGATRWISIGSFRFQPVEISKIFIIMFFAKYLMDHAKDLNSVKTIIRSLILVAVPLVLIFVQPDLKNTITVLVLFSVLYFAAGLSYKIIGVVLAVLIPAAIIFMFVVVQPQSDSGLLKGYQRDRIMAFLHPDDEQYFDKNTQQRNSVTAIGSGQLTGKGLNNSDVSSANKGNFISQIQTDFIFAVAGEELGFLGSAGIIILLLLIVFECLMISQKAKDISGRIICCGMACLISIQSFINISVACGMLPNTGTPLPFLSYGLTSLISMYIGMGFVLNVGLQSRIRIEARS